MPKNPHLNQGQPERYTKHPPKIPFFARVKRLLLYAVLLFVIVTAAICMVFRWLPPPTTMFMLNRHIDDLVYDHTFKRIDYHWISADKISHHAYAAVIASEDQRFFQHFGFDFNAIGNAIELYADGGELRGASTLSQQVAKNMFLTPSRSFVRKGLEVWFTLLIEALWGKARILEVYMNIAEFGDHLFGIEAASQRYFGIAARKMTPQQASLLATTLPNPIILRAMQPSAQMLRRQQWILRQMPNIGLPRG